MAYTKGETLNLILSGRKIRFGLLGTTNDPKETKLRQANFISIGVQYYDRNVEAQAREEFNRISSQEWKVLCTTRSLQNRKYKDSNKNFLMSKFRYGYNRPRMWAQYAENHSGACLVFDGKKLNNNILSAIDENSRLFKGSVDYENYSSHFPRPIEKLELLAKSRDSIKFSETIRSHYFHHYCHYFLSKFPDWKSESEYRWLIHNTINEYIFIDIVGALKMVLVGADFPKTAEASVIDICKELKVDVNKMSWVNGLPEPFLNSLYNSKE